MSNEVNDIWQHEFWQLGKVEDGRAMLLLTEDEYNSIRGAIAHREKMRSALEKIRDIYAGLDGMQPVTCAEGYLLHKLSECYDTATKRLCKPKATA